MKYTKGYKYRTDETVVYDISGWGLVPSKEINCGLLTLTAYGYLVIHRGYSWDGASGAIDTDTILFPSLVHDALYELLRGGLGEHVSGKFPADVREACDKIFRSLCLERKMTAFRAGYVYDAVRVAGFPASSKPRKVFEA